MLTMSMAWCHVAHLIMVGAYGCNLMVRKLTSLQETRCAARADDDADAMCLRKIVAHALLSIL